MRPNYQLKLDELLVRIEVNRRDNFCWTALHHACHANQADIAYRIVNQGADVDAQALNGGKHVYIIIIKAALVNNTLRYLTNKL